MKAFDAKAIEINNDDGFDSVDASIDESNIGMMFSITSKQMYRDPIGSIIREITSNCFDSHIEAGVDDAVVIKFDSDETGEFISFIDVGIGISPERFSKTYSKWFSSTKRDSDNQIGFFGLGSKSPFAYKDDFFLLNTVYNGIKYEYVISQGENKPKLFKVNEYETDERNGSEVRIYFNRPSDKRLFQDKIKEQLLYFDNVYVDGVSYNNTYTIYEGETFKHRSDVGNSYMHLCIGKVTYPIDYNQLGFAHIPIPVALKFNIGDLPITPERESVRYVEFTKDGKNLHTTTVIKEKIEAFTKEIREKAASIKVEVETFVEYDKQKGGRVVLELDDAKKHILDVTHTTGTVEPIFVPFKGKEFFYKIYNPFQFYSIHRRKSSYGKLNNNYDSRLSVSDLRSDNLLVREFTVNSKIAGMRWDYVQSLTNKSIAFIKEYRLDKYALRDIYSVFPKINKIDYSKYNKLKLYKYLKYLAYKELVTRSIDYNDLDIPEDYVTKWKELNKKQTVKVEGEFVVEDYSETQVSKRRKSYTSEQLEDTFFVYGINSDVKLLELASRLFTQVLFIKVKQVDYGSISKFSKGMYIDTFMTGNNEQFKRVAESLYIYNSDIWNKSFFDGSNEVLREKFKIILLPLYEAYNKLHTYPRISVDLNRNKEMDEFDTFVKMVYDMAVEKGIITNDVRSTVEKIDKYFKDLEILEYITINGNSLPLVVDLLIKYGKPVNKEWYAPESWQVTLLKESCAKADYLIEVSNSSRNAGTGRTGNYNRDREMELRRIKTRTAAERATKDSMDYIHFKEIWEKKQLTN